MRTAINESMPRLVRGAPISRAFSSAKPITAGNPSAQTGCDDALHLGGVELGQCLAPTPVVLDVEQVQFRAEVMEVAELADLGKVSSARSRRNLATPTLVKSPASTPSRASMPSAGDIGSSTLNDSDRARPTSAH